MTLPTTTEIIQREVTRKMPRIGQWQRSLLRQLVEGWTIWPGKLKGRAKKWDLKYRRAWESLLEVLEPVADAHRYSVVSVEGPKGGVRFWALGYQLRPEPDVDRDFA